MSFDKDQIILRSRAAVDEVRAENGRKVARQLGVRYNGLQKRLDRPSLHLFTDRLTGTTFAAEWLYMARETFLTSRMLHKRPRSLTTHKTEEI